MKASELISFLNDMISNYGDLEIVTQVNDAYEDDKASFGDVESVYFDAGRINICGKDTSISDWIDQYNSNCTINIGDHYSVFRKFDSPKESTGYANYDGREF